MASDATSPTEGNVPTFHRELTDFIPWALGHVGVGAFVEGESCYFLQLTKHMETNQYCLWGRRNIDVEILSRKRSGHNATSETARRLHGIPLDRARSHIAPPLATFDGSAAAEVLNNGHGKWLSLGFGEQWTAHAFYPTHVYDGLDQAFVAGIRLVEGINLDAKYVMNHATGRLWRMGIEHIGIDNFLRGVGTKKIDETHDASLYIGMDRVHSNLNYFAPVEDRFVLAEARPGSLADMRRLQYMPVTELYQPGGRNALLVVTDATSGERTVMRVPSTIQTAREAQAWTFGLHVDEYKPVREA